MQSTKCSVRVNIITINLCCHFRLPCSSSSLKSVASKDGKHFIRKEVIHLRLLDLKRNPHIQTWKSPQFCQNLYFLTDAHIFTSRERCQRVKKGENQSTLLHPVTPTATKEKVLSHHLHLGTSSPLWCVCKSQKDFLAATRTWLSNGEWGSSFGSLLLLYTFRSGVFWSISHRLVRVYATTAPSSHCELRVDFRP